MAARATLALKLGVWFRRGRLLIVSPDSLGTACPLSGRNSTYRPVQILEAGSAFNCCHHAKAVILILEYPVIIIKRAIGERGEHRLQTFGQFRGTRHDYALHGRTLQRSG